jgi:hypothetical protein
MGKLDIRINKRYAWIVPITIAIMITMVVYSYWPASRDKMKRSIAIVENSSYFQVVFNNKDTLFFDGIDKDSLFENLSYDMENIKKSKYSIGCWINKYALFPSCYGRLLTTSKEGNADDVKYYIINNFKTILKKETAKTKHQIKDLEYESECLKYYISVHGVQDEGFNFISQYSTKLANRRDSVEKVMEILSKTDSDAHIKVDYIPNYTVIYRDEDNKLHREHCRQITARSKKGFRMIQTDSKTTPSYACPQHFHHIWPWHDRNGKRIFIAGYGGLDIDGFEPSQANSTITAGKLNGYLGKQACHTISATFAQDGSPAFSEYGFFLGVNYQGSVINTRQFHFLFKVLK